MHTDEWIRNWKRPEILHEIPTRWGWTVSHPEGLHLGRWVDIGRNSYLQAEEGITVGDFVEIGGGCFLYSVDTIDDKRGRIIVENKAKIGAGSIVFPNIVIGENSVIGAGTIVTKNVPSNMVVRSEQRLIFRSLETAKRRSEAI